MSTVTKIHAVESPFFLVALPSMDDDYFRRAVVLITQFNGQGASGIIVNKILIDENDSAAQMRAEIKDMTGKVLNEFNEDLFEGGPVDDQTIVALHNSEPLGAMSESVGQGLFRTADANLFQKLLETSGDYTRRFYLGISEWAAGQLDQELRSGAWVVVPFKKDLLFSAPGDDKDVWRDDVWTKTLRAAGLDPFTLMGQGPNDAGVN
jgi:putative transcriptional regulator